MSNFNRYSRVNKFEKRRKNTKLISILMVAATILVLLLIGLWLFGPDDQADDSTNNSSQVDNANNSENTSEDNGEDPASTNDESSQSNDGENSSENEDNQSSENVDEQNEEDTPVNSEDENVISTINDNWEPVGTEQEGPHSINFTEDSQDRIEMEKAVLHATGLAEDDMIPWWLERGGDQQVIATVSNRAETAIYRVYLSWIDNQGWQPTLVEILEENDQKWRFE
ncbi:YrrS family protein [Ornithinibacillus halotolerans]|uniref:DUF1510 domain-containing protein n=1 Tax=Ornithinibacillus halotolerans TaxID=1274357 RepID=A0A916W5T6_9BACI|nr:YrrS family protein [Ornithinibacillus halotolerans]GGA69032.1 hypothetical protein GCM10008025_11240 [Ornithinibacillus halotolerans]